MSVQPAGGPVPVFYGTLGDIRQEPLENLPAPLAALRRAHDKLMASYANGELDRTTLALRLSSLVYTSPDGTVWTIGASSGHWYVRPRGRRNWELSSPPSSSNGIGGLGVLADSASDTVATDAAEDTDTRAAEDDLVTAPETFDTAGYGQTPQDTLDTADPGELAGETQTFDYGTWDTATPDPGNTADTTGLTTVTDTPSTDIPDDTADVTGSSAPDVTAAPAEFR